MKRHYLMATCVLVAALLLPALVHGRPATQDNKSMLNTLESHVSQHENLSRAKVISPPVVPEYLLIPTKTRQRRYSDQRRAELEALVTLSKINGKRSLTTRGSRQLDPEKIGRRRRFAVDRAFIGSTFTKAKRIGDATYPLIR
ncbi:hypothetical protein PUN28_007078 [Cardiocondyla obscurior]